MNLIERISWLCYKFNSFIISDRWLENLTVANKSITLLPYIKEYCNQAALNKTEPKEHAGYQSVKKAINEDKLLKAKHLFWISLAQDFQPFLKMYHTEKPGGWGILCRMNFVRYEIPCMVFFFRP